MSELEDMIGKILGDPAEMERIGDLASKLMGGAGSGGRSAGVPGLDPGMLEKMGKLMAGMQERDEKTELLSAMARFLKPERRGKLEKAMRISRFARLAEGALEAGGDV